MRQGVDPRAAPDSDRYHPPDDPASDGEETMAGKATVLRAAGLTILLTAATAALTAALWHPTPNAAAAAFGGTLVLFLYAACLAVGSNRPARSFWTGLLIAGSGTLILDEAARLGLLRPDIFTKELATRTADLVGPIGPRGRPGWRLYLRSSENSDNLLYYDFGDDGTPRNIGGMSLETARKAGIFETIAPPEKLRTLDSIPNRDSFFAIHRCLVSMLVGLGGAALSYLAARRRTIPPAAR